MGIGDETLTLPALLKTWCLPDEVGLRESYRCKELDLSDTELVGLVSEPADSAFLLFASSRAATSARDNCTGGGANIFAHVVSWEDSKDSSVLREKAPLVLHVPHAGGASQQPLFANCGKFSRCTKNFLPSERVPPKHALVDFRIGIEFQICSQSWLGRVRDCRKFMIVSLLFSDANKG